MTRHLDAALEERQTRRHEAVIRALEFELVGVIAGKGGELLGFSVRMAEWETLMTLRAVIEGTRQVAFVGSDDLINCILKAVRAGQRDKLKWQPDRFAK